MAAFAFTFAAWLIEDCLDTPKEVMINVWLRNKRLESETELLTNSSEASGSNEPKTDLSNKSDTDDLATLETSSEYWGAMNPPPTIHLSMSKDAKKEWRKSYRDDPMFRTIVENATNSEDTPMPGRQFLVDRDGMIFFNNENYQPRLCVPAGQRNFILKEAYESTFESAHVGPEKLWQSLSSRFYWK